MFTNLKASMPNIYIIIVAICISLWFEGVGIIIRHFIPSRELPAGIIMISIALCVFLLDDGNLSELYNFETNKDKLTRHAPAYSASRRD